MTIVLCRYRLQAIFEHQFVKSTRFERIDYELLEAVLSVLINQDLEIETTSISMLYLKFHWNLRGNIL